MRLHALAALLFLFVAGCVAHDPFPPADAGLTQWPAGAEPQDAHVFVHNEIDVAAPPEAVWRRLVRAGDWPAWFPEASDVHFDEGGPELAAATRVSWHMLGANIHVQVKRFEPFSRLDWAGGASGVHAYHAWLLVPTPKGTHVVTEETENGPLPSFLASYLRGHLHDAHQRWLEGLAKVAAESAPSPPAAATEGSRP